MIAKLKKSILNGGGAKWFKNTVRELESHQQLLMVCFDILIEIYMAESTILELKN